LDQNEGIMARFEQETHSFVIRLWRENRELPGATAVWRGWVEHIPTGQRHYFQDSKRLYDIVFDYLGQSPDLTALFTKLENG
jgi:hypothetical protein